MKNPKILQWGMYLIVLLYPFIDLQVVWGELNVPYVDLVALIVFLGWIIFLIKEKKFKTKYFPGLVFFLLFFASSLLSLINAPEFWVSLKYILRPLSFFYLMFVVLPYNLINNKKILLNVLKIFYGLGIFTALMGAASLVLISAPNLLAKRVVPLGIGDFYPLGMYHNQIAEVLVTVIPIGFLLMYLSKKDLHRKLYFLGTLLMLVINLLTFSRSAWIALFVQLLILLIIQYRYKLKKLLQPSLILFIMFLPVMIYMFIFSTQWQVESSNINRLMLIDVAMEIWQDYPLIGAGAGTFVDFVDKDYFYILEFGSALDAHGFVWKVLPEMGILGLITFLLLIGYVLYKILKSYQINQKNAYWSYLLVTFFLVALGSIIFQFFQTSYFLGRLWLPMGIGLVIVKLAQKNASQKK